MRNDHIADFLSAPSVIGGLEAGGELLWIVAYIYIIRVGFKDRSYGMPMVALALNITWEFLHTVIHHPGNTITRVLFIAWLLLDSVILYQLLRYGRKEQVKPARRYFFPIVGGLVVFAFLGHVLFDLYFDEPGGGAEAYLMNVVMSALFLPLFFSRPDARGLSYVAAWAKLAGTWLQAAGMQIKAVIGHDVEAYAFITYLHVLIMILDLSFVLLLRGHRTKHRQAA